MPIVCCRRFILGPSLRAICPYDGALSHFVYGGDADEQAVLRQRGFPNRSDRVTSLVILIVAILPTFGLVALDIKLECP